MTNPVSVNGYAVSVGSAPNVGMVPVIAPFSPTSINIVGPNGPFKIGQLWVNEVAGDSFQLVGLSSSMGVVSANWTILGASGSTTSVVGTLNQIGVSTLGGVSTVSLTDGISLGSFQTTTPPVGGILAPGQISTGNSHTDGRAQLYVDSTGDTYGAWVLGTMSLTDPASTMAGILGENTFTPVANVTNFISQFAAGPSISVSLGHTAHFAFGYFADLDTSSNVGTITNLAVFYASPGIPGVGTITNSYGGFFNTPADGAKRVALYADNLVIGDPTAVAPTNAIAVPLGICAFQVFTTVPASATAVTASFGSIVLGTPKQNVLTYNIIVNVCIVVTSATNATIQFGISRAAVPTLETQVPTFSTATTIIFNFSYNLPNNYFLIVNTTGIIAVASVTTSGTGV